MFSNKSTPLPTSPSLGNPAPQPAPRRSARAGVPSIISADLTVTGTLVSTGDVQVDGVVEGDVRSQVLVIGEKAEVRGEVLAEDVTVRGRVIGRIRARKVLLSATSHVEGDILHEAFAVEAGAFFEGNCRHSDDPMGDKLAAQNKPTAPPEEARRIPPPPQAITSAAPAAPRTGIGGLAPFGSAG